MTPSEFWRLHPTEYFWLLEMNLPKRFAKLKHFSDAEIEEIYEQDYGSED